MSTDPALAHLSYVREPSVGHEIGIMFGFLGAMALSTIAYVFAWRYGNRVGQKREQERIEALRASGYLKEKQDHDDVRIETKLQDEEIVL